MIKLKDARELTVSNLYRKIRRFCKKIDKEIKKATKTGLTQVSINRKIIHHQVFISALNKYEDEGYKVIKESYRATISWAEEDK